MDRIYVWGKNPALEVIRGRKRQIYKAFIQNTRKNDYRSLIPQDIPIQILDKGRMHNIIQRKDHQGIIVETDEYPYIEFSQFFEAERGYILVADNVTDPQNLGAMIRSATQLGALGILIQKRNTASISSVVTHTSAGATEHVEIAQVDSLSHSIEILRKHGFVIYGTHQPNQNTVDIREIQFAQKTVIVLGSEGEGIRGSISNKLDQIVSLPQTGIIDSYSVSAATAISCFAISNSLKVV